MSYSNQGRDNPPDQADSKGKPLSVEQYFAQQGLLDDTIQIVESKANPIEEYCDRHNLHKGTLKTVEAPRGSEIPRPSQGINALYVLLTPVFIAPFWLMWILSPGNAVAYTLAMRAAFLAALVAILLGLCWVVIESPLSQAGRES